MSGRSERNFFGPIPGGAIVSIAGQGYFFGGMLPANSVITGSGAGHTGNQVAAMMFVLPFTVTVRKITMRITVVFGAAQVFNLGIYSADRNTKLIEASFDANSATRQTVTLATPVVLSPGVYHFAWCPSGGATGQYAATAANAQASAEVGGIIPTQGTAANSMVAGVLPATLGVITASAAAIMNTCIGLFYP